MTRGIAVTVLAVCICVPCGAQQLPDAPSSDRSLTALEITAATGNAFDAVMTSRLSGLGCREDWSPWLYGRHPQPARVAVIMGLENVGVYFASRWLRHKHSKLWALPLAINGAGHWSGAIQNLRECR
jgi:hypothetical protein